MKEIKLSVDIQWSVALVDELSKAYFKEFTANPVFFISFDLENSESDRYVLKHFNDYGITLPVVTSNNKDERKVVMFDGEHLAFYNIKE